MIDVTALTDDEILAMRRLLDANSTKERERELNRRAREIEARGKPASCMTARWRKRTSAPLAIRSPKSGFPSGGSRGQGNARRRDCAIPPRGQVGHRRRGRCDAQARPHVRPGAVPRLWAQGVLDEAGRILERLVLPEVPRAAPAPVVTFAATRATRRSRRPGARAIGHSAARVASRNSPRDRSPSRRSWCRRADG